MARASLLNAVLDKAAEALSRGLVSHNFYIGKRRTSARFDALTWRALLDIADREGLTVNQLLHRHRRRKTAPFVTDYLRSALRFCSTTVTQQPRPATSPAATAKSHGGFDASAMLLTNDNVLYQSWIAVEAHASATARR